MLFDIYLYKKFVETVEFKSYGEACKFYPRHFGYSVRNFNEA